MGAKGHVSVHALDAGHLTLPERFFVTPVDYPEARKTVPSLCFLIQHVNVEDSKVTRLIFDLGIRRQIEDYPPPIRNHAMTRQPLSGSPDTVASLAAGNLTPSDIDVIIFSHLHWDHIGTPSDYPSSIYVVGPGAVKLIDGTRKAPVGSHNYFEQGLLDLSRTIELPPINLPNTPPPKDSLKSTLKQQFQRLFDQPWQRKGQFESAIDIFGDGSVFVVSAPGHLEGHINLLCRLENGKHVYLAGDSCHDGRLLSGEKEVACWSEEAFPGVVCCIHQNKAEAMRTLASIRIAREDPGELGELEVIFAHDTEWEVRAKQEVRFFPGAL